MDLLFTFVLSAALVAPDSGSVASRKLALLPHGAQVCVIQWGEQACNVTLDKAAPLTAEDALALLQSEHHFSFPILLLEDPATPTR
jgi:hypothetical protein